MTVISEVRVAASGGPRGEAPREVGQGSLALLGDPVARGLLRAAIPARLAYVARDGAPRVVPMLFHWTGEEVILTSWIDDPKVAALRAAPRVALTIDTDAPPFKALWLRGTADVTLVDGVAPEALPTFTRYFGPEEGRGWTERVGRMADRTARIAVRPTWVGVVDFETRFPGGMARRIGAATG